MATSIIEVYRRWPDRSSAISHLEQVRWHGEPTCTYCGADAVSRNRDSSREATAERWKCRRCKRSFSVTVGTIFHNSHVDLQRWFLLISLMLNAKKGLSAMQAARDLEMRRPTVWSMMHRVRGALKDDGKLLSGLVEMDEAYIGGKPRRTNRKDDHTPKPPGRGTSKTPVIGAVERGGRAKTRAISKTEMAFADMAATVKEWIDTKRSTLTTDEYSAYLGLNSIIAHRTINHSVSYVERDMFSGQFGPIHTNTIESLWAILNEITFRYNARNSVGTFDSLLHLASNP